MGCLFHFLKQIRLKLGKYGLLNKEYLKDSDKLLKDLSKQPYIIFKIEN